MEGTGDGPPPPPQQQQQQQKPTASKNKKKKSKKAEKGTAKPGNAGGGGGTAALPLSPGKGVAASSSSPQDDIDRIVRELNLSTVRGGQEGGGCPCAYFSWQGDCGRLFPSEVSG